MQVIVRDMWIGGGGGGGWYTRERRETGECGGEEAVREAEDEWRSGGGIRQRQRKGGSKRC